MKFIKESFLDDTSNYEYIQSKSVMDSDGFYTDYTWYKAEDGTHVFVFGDNDVYKPEDGYFDHVCDSESEAAEWFDSYNGFEDPDESTDVSNSETTHLKLSGNMIEIPIEDNSKVGELGHPIQHGIGDPRRKKEITNEATAVQERPLSNLGGTLSSVLLAHKDEVDTLFDKSAAIKFLDRILPEVRNKGYVAEVKQHIMTSRTSPVEYFYNIILKGDGDGTEKGGKISRKSQVRKWARESTDNYYDYKGYTITFANNGECSVISPDGKHLRGNMADAEARDFIDSMSESYLSENAVSSKLPEDIDDFLQELAQSQGMFDYNDIIKYSPTRKDISKLRHLMTEYEDAFDDQDTQDIAKQVSKIIKSGELTESVNELAHEVAIAMQHLMNDIGRDPTADDFADDVVAEIEKGLPEEEIPTDPIKYRDWASAIMCEVSRQLNSLKESYNIQFYQVFSNPEKPTDNGKMIAQAGTEDEAKAKGNELVGKGNYLIKAVCDDGKVRDVDLYNYFNESLLLEDLVDPDVVSYGYRIRCAGYTSHAGRHYFNNADRTLTFGGMNKNVDGFSVLKTKTSAVTRSSEVTFLTEEAAEKFAERMGLDDYYIGKTRKAYELYRVNTEFGEAYATKYYLESRLGKIPTYLLKSDTNNNQNESKCIDESLDDWTLAVYNNDELLKDNIWSVSDALEFIHDNGGNIIKKLENGEETVIWQDGKAVGEFIAVDFDDHDDIVYAKDGDAVETHKAPEPFNAFDWMYGKNPSLTEGFHMMVDLDGLASDVGILLDDSVLGENWIEVFPTADARPISSNGYYIPLEITGPGDVTKKATFTSRGGVVDVRFNNGSEAKCYDAKEIARFIAGEFGLSLNESKSVNEGTKQKRIACTTEFDNGNVIHNDWKEMSDEEAEELAKQRSIENPGKVYYVKYDDIMNPCSDYKWKNGQCISGSLTEAFSDKTYPYSYVSNDLYDYPEDIQTKYEDNWDELFPEWEADPKKIPNELWLTSEAFITKEDGWLQVSWGGWDNYEEFKTIQDCKEHVASQYDIFRWTKSNISKQSKDVVSNGNTHVKVDRPAYEFDDKGRLIYDGTYIECPTDVEQVVITNNVTRISDRAFYGCSKLTSVIIPDSVTNIGWSAFRSCSSLTSVTIPSSVTSIGDYAFYYCENLTNVTIPNSVISIGKAAFNYCSSLTDVTIPDSVITIGDWAFSSCTNLTSVTIGNNVRSIGDYAFHNCASLTSVTIPDSVNKIGRWAFEGCNKLNIKNESSCKSQNIDAESFDEAIEMTADEMKAEHGTDNTHIIHAGKEEKDRVVLKEDSRPLYSIANQYKMDKIIKKYNIVDTEVIKKLEDDIEFQEVLYKYKDPLWSAPSFIRGKVLALTDPEKYNSPEERFKRQYAGDKMYGIAVEHDFVGDFELAKRIENDPEYRPLICKYKDPLWSCASAIKRIVDRHRNESSTKGTTYSELDDDFDMYKN